MNNVALDTCIGLAFVFLLYSLLAGIVLELLAQFFGFRARHLHHAISRMLEDGDSDDRESDLKSLTTAFYASPLIKYLAENNASSKPSYLTPDNFSQTVIDILRTDNWDQTHPQMELIRNTLFPGNQNPATVSIGKVVIQPATLSYLRMIWIDAGNDAVKFKSKLESWYNDTMDRASGWYKRETQHWLLGIGFVLAVGFNIDAIAIAKMLSRDKNAREQVVSMAIEKYKSDAIRQTDGRASGDKLEKLSEGLVQEMDSAGIVLGLGWERNEVTKKYQDCRIMFLGWLITALALSLGAPFWFDLLNKFVQLRGTGPKPESKKSANYAGKTDNNGKSTDPSKRVG